MITIAYLSNTKFDPWNWDSFLDLCDAHKARKVKGVQPHWLTYSRRCLHAYRSPLSHCLKSWQSNKVNPKKMSLTRSAYELCFCKQADREGCFGQLYNGRTGTPARPMHRSQQPIRIGYTELVITIYGPSCTFLELIFPCLYLYTKATLSPHCARLR